MAHPLAGSLMVTAFEVVAVSSTQVTLVWSHALRHEGPTASTPAAWRNLPLPLQQRLQRRRQQLESARRSNNAGAAAILAGRSSRGFPGHIDKWHVQYSPRYLGRWLEFDDGLRVPMVAVTGLESGCRYSFRVRAHSRLHGWGRWTATAEDTVTLAADGSTPANCSSAQSACVASLRGICDAVVGQAGAAAQAMTNLHQHHDQQDALPDAGGGRVPGTTLDGPDTVPSSAVFSVATSADDGGADSAGVLQALLCGQLPSPLLPVQSLRPALRSLLDASNNSNGASAGATTGFIGTLDTALDDVPVDRIFEPLDANARSSAGAAVSTDASSTDPQAASATATTATSSSLISTVDDSESGSFVDTSANSDVISTPANPQHHHQHQHHIVASIADFLNANDTADMAAAGGSTSDSAGSDDAPEPSVARNTGTAGSGAAIVSPSAAAAVPTPTTATPPQLKRVTTVGRYGKWGNGASVNSARKVAPAPTSASPASATASASVVNGSSATPATIASGRRRASTASATAAFLASDPRLHRHAIAADTGTMEVVCQRCSRHLHVDTGEGAGTGVAAASEASAQSSSATSSVRVHVCGLCVRQLCGRCRCHTVYTGHGSAGDGSITATRVCLDCALGGAVRLAATSGASDSSAAVSSRSNTSSGGVSTPMTNSRLSRGTADGSTPTTRSSLRLSAKAVGSPTSSPSFSSLSSPLASATARTGADSIMLPSGLGSLASPSSASLSIPPSSSSCFLVLPHPDIDTHSAHPTSTGLQVLAPWPSLCLVAAIVADTAASVEGAVGKWSDPRQWTPSRLLRDMQAAADRLRAAGVCGLSSTTTGPFSAVSIPSPSMSLLTLGGDSITDGGESVMSRGRGDTLGSVGGGSVASIDDGMANGFSMGDGSLADAAGDGSGGGDRPATPTSPSSSTSTSIAAVQTPSSSIAQKHGQLQHRRGSGGGSHLPRGADAGPSTPAAAAAARADGVNADAKSSASLPRRLHPQHSYFDISSRGIVGGASPLSRGISNSGSSTSSVNVAGGRRLVLTSPAARSMASAVTPGGMRSPLSSNYSVLSLMHQRHKHHQHSSKSAIARVHSDGRVVLPPPSAHPAARLRSLLRCSDTILEYTTTLASPSLRHAVTGLQIAKVVSSAHAQRARDREQAERDRCAKAGLPPPQTAVHPCVRTGLVASSHLPLSSLLKQARLDLTREPGVVITGAAPAPPHQGQGSTPALTPADSSPGAVIDAASAPLQLGTDHPWAAGPRFRSSDNAHQQQQAKPVTQSSLTSSSPSTAAGDPSASDQLPSSSVATSRYHALGTPESYGHLEAAIRTHVAGCVGSVCGGMMAAVTATADGGAGGAAVVGDVAATRQTTSAKESLTTSSNGNTIIAATLAEAGLPPHLIPAAASALVATFTAECSRLIDAITTAMLVCCSRTHSGGDAHAICHDVYSGPGPMHAAPGQPAKKQLVLLRHAQPARWQGLGIAKDIIAASPPLHLTFPPLPISAPEQQQQHVDETAETNPLAVSLTRASTSPIAPASSSSLPIRIRTCDIYSIGDYRDLEASPWALLAATMVHEMEMVEGVAHARNSNDSSSNNVNGGSVGLRGAEGVQALVLEYGRALVAALAGQQPTGASSSTDAALLATLAPAAAVSSILPRLPVLLDVDRQLSIVPVGREPGEVRVYVLSATGLGVPTAGDADDDDEDESIAGGHTAGSSPAKPKKPKQQSLLQRLGLVSQRRPLPPLTRAVQRAMARKGLKVDVERLALAVASPASGAAGASSSAGGGVSLSAANDASFMTALGLQHVQPGSSASGSGASTSAPSSASDQATAKAAASSILVDNTSAPPPDIDGEAGGAGAASATSGAVAAASDAGVLLDLPALTYAKRYGVAAAGHTVHAKETAGDASGGDNTGRSGEAGEKATAAPTAPPQQQQQQSAFVVLRSGGSEVETSKRSMLTATEAKQLQQQQGGAASGDSRRSGTASSSTPGKAGGKYGDGKGNTGTGAGGNGGLVVPSWREGVVLQWDGAATVTMSLWAAVGGGGGSAATTQGEAGTSDVPISNNNTTPNTASSSSGTSSGVCLGTSTLSLMGLYPGLPERAAIPLITRLKVRVPVMHATDGHCVCEGKAQGHVSGGASSTGDHTSDGDHGDAGDDASGGEGLAVAGDTPDGTGDSDGHGARQHHRHHRGGSNGGGGMRNSFAAAGQLALVSPVKAAGSGGAGKVRGARSGASKAASSSSSSASAQPSSDDQQQQPVPDFETLHWVEECIEVETGRLHVELFYWPRDRPTVPVQGQAASSGSGRSRPQTRSSGRNGKGTDRRARAASAAAAPASSSQSTLDATEATVASTADESVEAAAVAPTGTRSSGEAHAALQFT